MNFKMNLSDEPTKLHLFQFGFFDLDFGYLKNSAFFQVPKIWVLNFCTKLKTLLFTKLEYGAFEQTKDHVLIACPIYRAPHRARGLTFLDDETRCCFTPLLPASDPGSTAAWDSTRMNLWPQSCLCLT